MQDNQNLDQIVGRIVGAIYGDIAVHFSYPPLMLVPPMTLKVKKRLEQASKINLLSEEERKDLANEIQMSLIPLLYSLEIQPEIIDKMAPVVETAAFNALEQLSQKEQS